VKSRVGIVTGYNAEAGWDIDTQQIVNADALTFEHISLNLQTSDKRSFQCT